MKTCECVKNSNSLKYPIILTNLSNYVLTLYTILKLKAAAFAQLVRAFAKQAEGWVFESQPRQTKS